MRELSGTIVTLAGPIAGCLGFERRITGIVDDPGLPLAPPFILPGFIDLHVHGGGGAEAMRGEAEVRTMAAFHARHGTTSLLPTTVTAPDADLLAAAEGIGRVVYEPRAGEARVLGLHLEGPFINAARLGAQPPFARAPDFGLVQRLLALCPVPVATYAPEIDTDALFLGQATAAGIRCQIGHSDADFAACAAALDGGAVGFTHLFNAMRPFHHREPGCVGAALALASFAEIIPDFVHVDAGAIRLALRAVPNLYAVTDAIAAVGEPDGFYSLGTHRVAKQDGRVTLADGTIAGSVLTMDAALRNLTALGLPLSEAARRCATIAADHLGLVDRGRIAVGAHADLVVLDADLMVQAVYVEGEPVHEHDAG